MAANLIAEIDEAELTLRMMEAVLKLKRPPGKDARAALADLQGRSPSSDAMIDQMRDAGRAAVGYFTECMANSRTVS